MSRFQIIFTGLLIVFGVAGAILFAVAKNKGSEAAIPVEMWGAVSEKVVRGFLSDSDALAEFDITYKDKPVDTFESELISALASGKGPDMILLPQDLILKQLDKFYVIPFESYSARDFKDSFIEEGELYMFPTGIVGLPFMIDPLVMYWNRDIFRDAGIALPPSSWVEFAALVPKITKKDGNGNITQSLAALGETRNVTNAKDMISLLSLQAGTKIVVRGEKGVMMSVFDQKLDGTGLVPAEQAISFYTQFSNPLKQTYSWNRSMPADKAAFTGGKLALYFGYASELEGIRSANPNLNFDVALVPQAESRKLTYGRMHAVALLKSSKNVGAAFLAADRLTGAAAQSEWAQVTGLPPVRKSLLAKLPGDEYRSVFYKSALMSTGWLDPNKEETKAIFQKLVEAIISGKLRPSDAVSTASKEIRALF